MERFAAVALLSALALGVSPSARAQEYPYGGGYAPPPPDAGALPQGQAYPLSAPPSQPAWAPAAGTTQVAPAAPTVATDQAPPTASEVQTSAAPPPTEVFEAGKVVATVGNAVILEGEVPRIGFLKANESRLPPEQREDQWQKVRTQLDNLIETKMVYLDFQRTVPAENMTKIEENVAEQFEKTYVKKLLDQAGTTSRADLEVKLRNGGTSLDRQRRAFIERSIASSWLQQQIKDNEEISRERMLAYYQEHLADYTQPAKARWEQLTVSKSKRYKSEDEAYQAIAEYGNEILRGASFADVAKAHSDDSTSYAGGMNDWTSQGSLVSKALDAAIFSLPVARMSQIIDGGDSYHIIRVVERKDVSYTSFVEAQGGIKKKIREESLKKQTADFMARLKRETTVWTMFDEQQASKPTSIR